MGKFLKSCSLFWLLASCAYGQACDKTLWRHIYHKPRLVVQQPCVSVTGTIMDASHGKNKDGARHEADGDGHFWLKLDPGQEKYLNAENKAKQDGNLVFEPVCRYKVTQADAKAACKGYNQPLVVPAVGTHVRMDGAWVLDKQHGHMEIHPVSEIAEIMCSSEFWNPIIQVCQNVPYCPPQGCAPTPAKQP